MSVFIINYAKKRSPYYTAMHTKSGNPNTAVGYVPPHHHRWTLLFVE